MTGPERHRRANHLHPSRQPRNGRDAQRELKHRRADLAAMDAGIQAAQARPGYGRVTVHALDARIEAQRYGA